MLSTYFLGRLENIQLQRQRLRNIEHQLRIYSEG